ncbi:DNA helicase [Tanacetum coccineum]|uniref:ATP-dependent DNA helicase n=1 Tax=Tanacetum coccineum TaxID=301880 RepID=A0ABQ5DVM2_9ASTR
MCGVGMEKIWTSSNTSIMILFIYVSPDLSDDNVFNSGSIQEDTPISEESIERRKTPSVDVQILGIGGNINTHLSIGGHDMVPTTTVPVLRIFDCFRNMRLNSLGSNYMSHTDNRYRVGDQQIRTRTLENAGYPPITDEISVPNVHKRGCLHTVSTTSSLEESIQRNTIRTEDILGHTASSSRMAPVNHAYLCMDVTDCIIRPEIIAFPNSSAKNVYQSRARVPVSRIFDRFRNCRFAQPPAIGSDYMSHEDCIRWCHTASSSRMAPVNHAYLCIDVMNCIIRPEIITFPNSSMKNVYQSHARGDYLDTTYCRSLHNEVSAINECSTLGTQKTSQSRPLQTAMYNQPSSSRNVPRRPQNQVKIDEYISAEIPDPVEDPRGYKVVTELMMHGPCGVANLGVLCMENGACNKHFPKRPIGDTSTSMGEKHIQVDEIQNYIDGRKARQMSNMPGKKKTTLTEWYVYNNENTDGRHLTYLDFPSEFVWYPNSKSWHRRVVKTKKSLGRLAYVHPNSGELFYFRMLLCHQKVCKSPTEVRTVNGHVLPTYRAACEALGLLGDKKEWDITLEESIVSASSAEISMKDDIPAKVSEAIGILNYHVNTPKLQGYILYELEAILNGFGKSVKDFGLPPPPERLLKDLRNKLLIEERNYKRDLLMQDATHFVPKLNHDQKEIYNLIINASKENRHELLFVYGHGIVSLLLPSGRTAHSRFKLPLDLTDESVCHAKKHSQLANLLIETDLIIWDEAPMNDRRCFEALDKTHRYLMNAPEILFGGKTIVLGGEFRQTLPVKEGAAKEELINASIAESYLWLCFKICKIKENMSFSSTKDQK